MKHGSITIHPVNVVQNVEFADKVGEAVVFENEAQADLAYNGKGYIICCGGYYNAIWTENPKM